MSPNRAMRGLIATLAVVILGVIALDATAIVAAPRDDASHGATAGALTPTRPAFRLIMWSGQVWLVNPPNQNGPEGDPMSDSNAAVHVDAKGRLHLAVTSVHGVWRSVQLESLTPLHYGTYRFVTSSSIATLTKPLDFGMFIYRVGTAYLRNEIDLEDSSDLIAMHGAQDAQYVVQPYYKPHHILRYVIGPNVAKTQQQFIWTNRDVKFITRAGTAPDAPIVNQFHYHGRSAPTPVGEHVYINLFLHGGAKWVGSTTRTAVVDSFTYTPSD
jgi:hypothetical protein